MLTPWYTVVIPRHFFDWGNNKKWTNCTNARLVNEVTKWLAADPRPRPGRPSRPRPRPRPLKAKAKAKAWTLKAKAKAKA